MKHSRPILALLVALAAAGACAQTTGTVKGQAPTISYGPVLGGQETPAPAAGADTQLQAREEQAGAPPQPPKKASQARPAPRRSVQQRVQGTPRIVAPDAARPSANAYGRIAAPPPGLPPVAPAPAPITTCSGGVCVDSAGAAYNTGVGNAAVGSGGRLCTRSGATMQCF